MVLNHFLLRTAFEKFCLSFLMWTWTNSSMRASLEGKKKSELIEIEKFKEFSLLDMGFNSEIDLSINVDKGLPPLEVIRRITDLSNRRECWSRIRFRIGGNHSLCYYLHWVVNQMVKLPLVRSPPFFCGALVAFSTADSSTRSTGYDIGSDEFIETGSTAGVTTIAEPHFDLYLSLKHK